MIPPSTKITVLKNQQHTFMVGVHDNMRNCIKGPQQRKVENVAPSSHSFTVTLRKRTPNLSPAPLE